MTCMARAASALGVTSQRLFCLGFTDEALAAMEESLDLYRTLAKCKRTEYDALFASALGSSSTRLSDLGLHEEALLALDESVAVYNVLVEHRPKEFNSQLASALGKISELLHDCGQPNEALEAARQSVAVYRNLMGNQPTECHTEFACALLRLSTRLSDLGLWGDVWDPIHEFLEIHLQRSKARQEDFYLDPGDDSMSSPSSTQFSGLNYREEALAIIQECLAMHHKRRKDRLAVPHTEPIKGLGQLSARLSAVRRFQEALMDGNNHEDEQPSAKNAV